MARFHFRLDTLLRWRERQVEMSEIRLKSALAVLQAVEAEMESWRERRVQAQRYVLTAVEFQPGELAAVSDFGRLALVRLEELHPRLLEAMKQVEACQAELMELRRKVKLLERLKERRREEWQAAEDHALEESLSEMQLIGRLRQQRTEARRKQLLVSTASIRGEQECR